MRLKEKKELKRKIYGKSRRMKVPKRKQEERHTIQEERHTIKKYMQGERV